MNKTVLKKIRMPIKVVVACTNANGSPDFYFVKVDATKEQEDNGLHYEAAKIQAAYEGYECPWVCFDEKDGPSALFAMFGWNSASTIPGDIKRLCNLT